MATAPFHSPCEVLPVGTSASSPAELDGARVSKLLYCNKLDRRADEIRALNLGGNAAFGA
jgi:hypothetical protein